MSDLRQRECSRCKHGGSGQRRLTAGEAGLLNLPVNELVGNCPEVLGYDPDGATISHRESLASKLARRSQG
jgi:hypothetical protein